ncbi:MAG: hypothetical protein NVSMB6_14480 [Burkholderiaceae bacterium]
MTAAITVWKLILTVLAVIGAVVVLGAVSMATMHASMMGNSSFHGMWNLMTSMCRGMMGS